MLGQKSPEVQFGGQSRVQSLVGILLVLAALALYAFLARPMAAEYAAAKTGLADKQGQLETLKTKLKSLEDTESNFGLSDLKLREMLKAVPVGLNQDDVLRDLVDIASANNIKLRSLGFGKSEGQDSKIGTLKINASFEGDYDDLIVFLQGLETNARALKVSSISVQINALSVTDVKRATFSLTLDSYYQN